MPQDEFAQFKRKAAPEDEFAQFKRQSAPPTTPAPTGTISAAPTGVKPWLQNLESDVRTGSTSTLPGRVLHAMGAKGLESGVSKPTAEFMGSPVLGPIHTAQGVADTPKHPVRGPLKAAGGVLETLTIPSAFIAPEAVGEASNLLPSAERAGQSLQGVMSVARNNPVDVAGPGNVALEIDKVAGRGGWLPKVVRDFLKRTTDPTKGPLTYEEARDFYQNATRLSADETNRLTPNAKRMIGKFTKALGDSVRGTAADAGQLKQYESGMKEYYRAMRTERQWGALKKYAIKPAIRGLPYGAGLAGGYELEQKLTGKWTPQNY
jgi:hypothetical protein